MDNVNINNRAYLRFGRASDISAQKEQLLYRALEMLPGFLAWGTLIGVVVFSAIRPLWVAVFIILFDVYWLWKTIFLSIHLVAAYGKIKQNVATDWTERLDLLKPEAWNRKLKTVAVWSNIHHLVIVPFYNEPVELIHSSLAAISESRYPLNKLIMVLASEARGGEHARDVSALMEREFGKLFLRFIATVHPENIAGEIAGKGSNETWAGKQAQKVIDELGIPYEHVVVSVFDSDTQVQPGYFGCLTWHYLTAADPLRTSFQPVPVFNNNIWDVPFFSRVVATSSTFWHMMNQERQERLTTFSSHSMSFAAIAQMDFWQTNVVSEDSRVFWQALLAFDGNYRVVPLHYPVIMDACLGQTFWQTVKNQYKQQRRWGWGVENVPYTLFGFWKNRGIAFSKKAYYAFVQLENYWSWSTNAILIFLLGWLPLTLGGEEFNQTVLSYNLPLITRTLMTLALIGIFVSAAISMLLLPARPKRFARKKSVGMALQWLFLPFSIMFFGTFPGLEAQTRLMLGRYMGFWVTEKVRKTWGELQLSTSRLIK